VVCKGSQLALRALRYSVFKEQHRSWAKEKGPEQFFSPWHTSPANGFKKICSGPFQALSAI